MSDVGPGWSDVTASGRRWLSLRGPLTLGLARRAWQLVAAVPEIVLDGEDLEEPPQHAIQLVLLERIGALLASATRAVSLVPPRAGPGALAWAGLTLVKTGATLLPQEVPRPDKPVIASEAVVFAVRRELAREPRHDLRAVALRVGRPAERLARELLDLGTSFSAEQRTARIGLATELLAQTDLKVEPIAADIGYASKPSFIAALRDLTGCTPSGLRAMLRDGQSCSDTGGP